MRFPGWISLRRTYVRTEFSPSVSMRAGGVSKRKRRRVVGSRSTLSVGFEWRSIVRFLPYLAAALVATCLPLAGYKLWLVVLSSPALSVRSVEVSGNVHISAAEVIARSGIEEGTSLLMVDEEEVEERIGRLAWVRRVEVERRLPDTVAIRIEERKAEAILLENGAFLVDEEGNIFKEMTPEEYRPDLLVIAGLDASRMLRDEGEDNEWMVRSFLAEAIALHKQYQERGLERYCKVNEVHFDQLLGFDLVGAGGQVFHVGFGDYARKLDRLAVVLGDLAARNSPVSEVHLDNEVDPRRVAVSGTNVELKANRRSQSVPAAAREMLP